MKIRFPRLRAYRTHHHVPLPRISSTRDCGAAISTSHASTMDLFLARYSCAGATICARLFARSEGVVAPDSLLPLPPGFVPVISHVLGSVLIEQTVRHDAGNGLSRRGTMVAEIVRERRLGVLDVLFREACEVRHNRVIEAEFRRLILRVHTPTPAPTRSR